MNPILFEILRAALVCCGLLLAASLLAILRLRREVAARLVAPAWSEVPTVLLSSPAGECTVEWELEVATTPFLAATRPC